MIIAEVTALPCLHRTPCQLLSGHLIDFIWKRIHLSWPGCSSPVLIAIIPTRGTIKHEKLSQDPLATTVTTDNHRTGIKQKQSRKQGLSGGETLWQSLRGLSEPLSGSDSIVSWDDAAAPCRKFNYKSDIEYNWRRRILVSWGELECFEDKWEVRSDCLLWSKVRASQ